MAITKSKPIVVADKEEIVTYKEKRFLFGVIKWAERAVIDSLGTDIIIESKEPIRDVYVNGKKYSLTK